MSLRRVLLLFVGAAGCGDALAQDPIDVGLAELPCASGPAAPGQPWESAEWPPFETPGCAWLRFDGRQTYRIEHELGRRPRSVGLYLSFEEAGVASAPSAGDATRILEVGPDAVTIRNGTHQDFFLKVVLE